MFRSLKALIVDYIKLTGVAVLVAAAQYVLWPWLFHKYVLRGMSAVNVSPEWDPSGEFVYYFCYFGMALIASFSIGVMTTNRLVRRNKLLPLSTGFLATWHWVSIIATVAVFNLGIQLAYWKIFDQAWPIVTTTIGMCTISAALVACGLWLRDCRIHRLVLALLFAVGVCYWCIRRLHGAEFSQPIVGWYQLTALDCLVVVVMWGVSWLLMYSGYAGYRAGESLKGAILTALTEQSLRTGDSGKDRPLVEFKSLKDAFLRMDWVRVRPISYGLYGGMQFGVGSLFWMLLRGNVKSLNGIPVLFLMFCGIMGWMLGTIYAAASDTHSTGPMNSLAGSLPLSDRQLGRFVTLSIGRFAAVTWISMLVSAAGVLLASLPTILTAEFQARLIETTAFQQAGPAAGLLLIAASFFLSWAGCGLGASIAMLTQKNVGLAFMVITLIGLVCGIATAFEVPYARQTGLGLLAMASVVGCGFGSLWLMTYAKRSQLLSSSAFTACVASALIVCVLTFVVAPVATYWKVVAAGFSVLAIVPVASIPTAMSWNRHR